jgi:uncharacterized protein (DUF58 family)
LNTPILPSRVLVLLAAASLSWIAILTGAVLALTGSGISALWIVAGALVFALAVWVIVMFREFRLAAFTSTSAQVIEQEERAVRSPAIRHKALKPRRIPIFPGFSGSFRRDSLTYRFRSRHAQRPNRSVAR